MISNPYILRDLIFLFTELSAINLWHAFFKVDSMSTTVMFHIVVINEPKRVFVISSALFCMFIIFSSSDNLESVVWLINLTAVYAVLTADPVAFVYVPNVWIFCLVNAIDDFYICMAFWASIR